MAESRSAFSKRELEVIDVLLQGHSNLKMSEILFIEEATIKFHLTSIFKKAGCKSRSEFIVKSLKGQLDFKLFPVVLVDKFDL